MMRSSVVLPEPEGPSSATSSPEFDLEAHVVDRGELAEALGDVADLDAHDRSSFEVSRFDDGLHDQRHQREERQQRRARERAREVVFVVEDLDVQRQRVGHAADVARHDRHRAELAHRARVAEDDAVEQAPLHVGQRHAPEDLPGARAERGGGFLFLAALRLHERDQLARDEREGDEHRRQHDAGHREEHVHVVRGEACTEPALQAEDEHVDQARDHRRHRERQVDERDQQRLAAEIELGDRPGRGDAEDEVERNGDCGGDQRQPDRRERVGLLDRCQVEREAFAQAS